MKITTAKLAAASLLIGLASISHAQLKPLDDKALSEIQGQAGLTIDIEFKLSIGEIAYHDHGGGSIVAQGVRMGGHGMSTNEHPTKRKRR